MAILQTTCFLRFHHTRNVVWMHKNLFFKHVDNYGSIYRSNLCHANAVKVEYLLNCNQMCKLFCFPIIHRHTNFTRTYDIKSQQFEKAQSETGKKIWFKNCFLRLGKRHISILSTRNVIWTLRGGGGGGGGWRLWRFSVKNRGKFR